MAAQTDRVAGLVVMAGLAIAELHSLVLAAALVAQIGQRQLQDAGASREFLPCRRRQNVEQVVGPAGLQTQNYTAAVPARVDTKAHEQAMLRQCQHLLRIP